MQHPSLTKIWIVIASIIIITNYSYAFSDAEIKDEIKVGRSVAAIIAGTYDLYDNPVLLKYVNLVGESIAYYNGRTELSYHFAILDTEQINAYACPGGYIFISKGLIYSLANEAQLAAVLAHEIAHVNYRHVYESVSQPTTDKLDTILARMIGGKNTSMAIVFNQLVNKSIEILFQEGLPHEQEYVADAAGLNYLAIAGYQKKAYFELLASLQSVYGQKKEEFSVTHPAVNQRLANLRIAFPETNLEKGLVLEGRFNNHVN